MNTLFKKTCTLTGILALSAGCAQPSVSANSLLIAEAKIPENTSKITDPEQYAMSEEYYDFESKRWVLTEASQRLQPKVYDFYEKTMRAFLKTEDDENKVYSPLNVYIALGMLAECTAGETQQQILSLLGAENTGELREIINAAWSSNSVDNPILKELLANSIWLSQDTDFHKEVTDILAEKYHASSYRGKMGSEELNTALQTWLNDNTGHLLEEYAKNIKTKEDTLMALASALYLKASWADSFSHEATTEDVFHAKSGDVTAQMMHRSETCYVYSGENWKAISLYLTDCGNMWFILPDEGVDLNEVLDDPAVYKLIQGDYDSVEGKNYLVNMTIPKLDVSSQMSLIEELQKLGVTDVFTDQADFSNLTDKDAFVSEITHAARLKSDEDGVEAAAFTVIMMTEGAYFEQLEEIDFTADRPFLFALTAADNSVLFTGAVNTPSN